MKRPRNIPKHTDSNGWWFTLPEPPTARILSGSQSARTVVIGAGVCGIAAAHQLGNICPNDQTIVLEAERAGFGASGRNAGFMLNVHSHGPPKKLDILRRNMNLWHTGLEDLRRRVREFQIPCDWSEAGRFYGAAGPDGEKHIDEICETLGQLDLPHEWLDRSDMQGRIGTQFYNRGLFTPGNALVNPAALMRGCAEHFPINVTMYEETPVIDIERDGQGFLVKTPQGQVRCDRIVLAAGVFMRSFGVGNGRIVPMATYASLTDPLSAEHLSQLGSGAPFGILGGSEYGATIRLTEDNRLFVRNHFDHSPGSPASAAKVAEISNMHRQSMLSRWPGFKDLAFTHSWGGTMAFTWNDGAILGEVEPGIFAVLTNDVSPMTRGTASGRLLVDLMEGRDSELLSIQLSLPEARRLPPRPILDLGIAYERAKLHRVAKQEF